MRKILLTFLLCLPAFAAWAGEPTTDHLTITANATVQPGSDDVYTFMVKMNSVSRQYTAINMDLHLPDGLEVQTNSNGRLLVSIDTSNESMVTDDLGENYHALGATFGVVGKGVLRVAITSTQNDLMKQADGNLFSFKVKATPFLKPGTAAITMDNIAFIIKEDAKAYEPAEQANATFTVDTQSTLTVNVSSENKWSTCILPFSCQVPNGVGAYTCSEVSGDYVVLNAVTAIEAYKPYILYAETGFTKALSGAVVADNYVEVATEGLLRGAIVAQQVTTGYVLQNQDGTAKFYDVDGQVFTIPAGRCWLVTNTEAPKALGFTTGTTDMGASLINSEQIIVNSVYDLQGRRVLNPEAGRIYVIGGKKVLKLK